MARIKKTYSRPKNTPPTKRRRDQAIKAKNKPKRPKRQRPLPTPYIPDDFKYIPFKSRRADTFSGCNDGGS